MRELRRPLGRPPGRGAGRGEARPPGERGARSDRVRGFGMADEIVIRAEGLGKKYLIGHQAPRERYYALRDVIARGAGRAAPPPAETPAVGARPTTAALPPPGATPPFAVAAMPTDVLATQLARVEHRYEQVRPMRGGDIVPPQPSHTGPLSVAYGITARAPEDTARYEHGASPPTHWPLSEPGVITREQVGGSEPSGAILEVNQLVGLTIGQLQAQVARIRAGR